MDIHNWIIENIVGTPVIFEIGANTGSDTVKLAAIPNSKVHAFEPEPRCELSGMPANVTVNRLAISDKNGTAEFHLSEAKDHIWTYSSSLLKPKNHLTTYDYVWFDKVVNVTTLRLDDYCKTMNVQEIDFIWMDVQGAEGNVFAGATEILKRTRYIYTEYSDKEMYEGQKTLAQLLEMLGTYEIVYNWDQPVTKNVLLKNMTI